jgi:hypothetical protein
MNKIFEKRNELSAAAPRIAHAFSFPFSKVTGIDGKFYEDVMLKDVAKNGYPSYELTGAVLLAEKFKIPFNHISRPPKVHCGDFMITFSNTNIRFYEMESGGIYIKGGSNDLKNFDKLI